ncbi:MAG: tetraacyldisaccharide 4'-kinase [Armatimonadota bacterium]
MRIENLWFGQGLRPFIGRILLLPLTALYSLAWSFYLLMYRYRIKRSVAAHPRVLCIGNLTAGGSGKTPVTIFVVECLVQLGFKPVVSCSGYGSPKSEAASVTPNGPLDPITWGDEPAEIRDFRPTDNIIVGRDRVIAASLASKEFPGSILVLDDGFQHLPLHKHITIILDSLDPLNALPFPSGPYREPRWNRARADLVLPSDRFRVEYSPLEFTDMAGNRVETPLRASILSAIARPDLFEASVREAGVEVASVHVLPDHDPLDASDLFSRHNEGALIVTMKDWVKIRTRSDIDRVSIVIAKRRATIEPREEFLQWLKERIPE